MLSGYFYNDYLINGVYTIEKNKCKFYNFIPLFEYIDLNINEIERFNYHPNIPK